ncbi:AAA family ATPase [Micromonospora tulbaghiae]|uniref:AAA family ATPase n=1 Tax=Micromonospora tulbaghiae TaxID=479978 RepID=UPI0033F13B9D
MPLRKIVLENYRCFRDRQEIELAPVTVVLGKNNSGKSVLTRAPLVIATGFNTTSTAPLDLDRLEPQPVDGFADLVFEQSPHGKFFLGFEVDGPAPFAMDATIQLVDEERTAFVSDLRLAIADQEFALSWQPTVTDGYEGFSYQIQAPGRASVVRAVPFAGLRPRPAGIPELRPLGERQSGLSLGPIRFLSAYRDRPERQHRLPLGTPRGIGEQGQGTLGILAHDQARNNGELLDRVNKWLALIVPGWQIEEIEAGPLWSTVLTRGGSRVRVNLADAGTGLSQILPVLVQCAMDELRAADAPAALQIIEEPEMHLHPGAHAQLADLYLNTAKATGTRFLIETHSETLLLRLRRHIAEGCPPEMVAVYVVEQHEGVSDVRQVGIDKLGNLDDDWPEGYFSQDYHEVRALAAAQMRQGGYAS